MSAIINELERQWKKDRDPSIEMVLRDAYLEMGREPYGVKGKFEGEFDRLKKEVDDEVDKEIIEELSNERGNLDDWKIQLLSAEAGYGIQGVGRGAPDFVTADGFELWKHSSIYLPTGQRTVRSMDSAPEWAEADLKGEHGEDAEFVTIYGANPGDYIASVEGKPQALYARVAEYTLGERECPFATWDPEEHEETRKNVVKVSDTWFGTAPGERCRLCEADVGDKHGYLYRGDEPEEVVYMRIASRAELTTANDHPVVEAAVRAAFEALPIHTGDYETFFEHGQWWVRLDELDDEEREVTYAVHDLNAGDFDFERV